jgi:hypothetical protein
MLAGSGPPAVMGWPGAEVARWRRCCAGVPRWWRLALPSPPVWARVLGMARRGAGALLVPVTWEALVPLLPGSSGEAIVQRSGVNLVREIPA